MTACNVLIRDVESLANVSIRPLLPTDVPRIKELCQMWFPIK